MKHKKMEETSHRFLTHKKKILKKLVYVMITQNISSNLRCVVRSAVTNEFNTVHNTALH